MRISLPGRGLGMSDGGSGANEEEELVPRIANSS